MKSIGLAVVVIGCYALNSALGFSDNAVIVGTIVGAGSYIIGITK